jgi:multidrug efflux pump subunit AcrB
MTSGPARTFLSRTVETFLHGNLSILLILFALLAGTAALLLTPREEEPQIVVPLADVLVQVPGASAAEVEQQVASRLERLLAQIDGVEYVYSQSRAGQAVVTVRFYVGEDRERSLVKLYNKLNMNADALPPGVTGWVVKPVEIDDVPIVTVALCGAGYSDYELRRLAEQVEVALQSVPDTARTEVVGGRRRRLTVYLDAEQLAARQLTPLEVAGTLRAANANLPAGGFSRDNRYLLVESGPHVRDASDLEALVVGVSAGRPVHLHDVACVRDGPEEPETYSRIFFGPASPAGAPGEDRPAVTVAVAKRKGSNAVRVAGQVEAKLAELRRDVLPAGVDVLVTRNYGATADDKVGELVKELALAVLVVVGLVAFTLGWREAVVVVTAVPLTFALTLLVNYLAGYSINRVTLFALILSLGLVVDDPIVDVENVFRHLRLGREPPLRAVLSAVNEVRAPIVVATLVVVVSFLPMVFITGLMGPYMRPMALNVPVAMLMSMAVAFTVTPWLSYHLLKGRQGPHGPPTALEQGRTWRVYAALVRPFLDSRPLAWLLLAGTAALLVLSAALPLTGRVPLKMLPFDNKNEFQLVADLPEGTTLEATDAALGALARHLCQAPEVATVVTYAGTASPMDFNGLVRHYYLRRVPHRGDLRVNLVPRTRRQQQSHAILLRLRRGLEETARQYGANVKLVEVPPGPPVLSTVVAEVYGASRHAYADLTAAARSLRQLFETEPGVVDVDDTVEADQGKYRFVVDKEKAALHGISTESVAATVRLALQGASPGGEAPATAGAGVLHQPRELNPLPIVLRLPRSERSSPGDLERLSVKGATGQLVPLAELGHFEPGLEDQTIYHKNQERVVYLLGETAGRPPAEAVLGLQGRLRAAPLPDGMRVEWAGEGEWKITLDVFRDLGLAFGGAVLGIYLLLVWHTGSYTLPLVRMIAIPLTLIGILPGFWLLNELGSAPVGGYANPVYFTATAMIGMIALAGIADRNAILLLDFIHTELARGRPLRQALFDSGAVRFRPIFLTAGAALLGAWPITLDPVFAGLAWALIFGLVVSTAFTLVLVPVVYWMLYRNHPRHGLPEPTVLLPPS